MKNLLIVCSLLIVTSSAYAESYTDITKLRLTCEKVGNLAVEGFRARSIMSESFTPIRYKAASESVINSLAGTPGEKALRIQAVNYGLDSAGSLEDAYRISWARCMDYYNFN